MPAMPAHEMTAGRAPPVNALPWKPPIKMTTRMTTGTIPSGCQAYRAGILHFHADPAFNDNAHAWHEDGLLVVRDGRVQAAGDYARLSAALPPGTPVHDYRD